MRRRQQPLSQWCWVDVGCPSCPCSRSVRAQAGPSGPLRIREGLAPHCTLGVCTSALQPRAWAAGTGTRHQRGLGTPGAASGGTPGRSSTGKDGRDHRCQVGRVPRKHHRSKQRCNEGACGRASAAQLAGDGPFGPERHGYTGLPPTNLQARPFSASPTRGNPFPTSEEKAPFTAPTTRNKNLLQDAAWPSRAAG